VVYGTCAPGIHSHYIHYYYTCSTVFKCVATRANVWVSIISSTGYPGTCILLSSLLLLSTCMFCSVAQRASSTAHWECTVYSSCSPISFAAAAAHVHYNSPPSSSITNLSNTQLTAPWSLGHCAVGSITPSTYSLLPVLSLSGRWQCQRCLSNNR
jgi:hypothetical protein